MQGGREGTGLGITFVWMRSADDALSAQEEEKVAKMLGW